MARYSVGDTTIKKTSNGTKYTFMETLTVTIKPVTQGKSTSDAAQDLDKLAQKGATLGNDDDFKFVPGSVVTGSPTSTARMVLPSSIIASALAVISVLTNQ